MNIRRMASLLSTALTLVLLTVTVTGQETTPDQPKSSDTKPKSEPKLEAKPEAKQKVAVADGYLMFEAPASWKKMPPKFDFIHADFTIPKMDGDATDGRITFSQVGGSVDENLDRWFKQFKAIDKSNEEQVMRKKETVSGKEVQLVKISGTFLDSAGGPLGPQTEREGYVLYGAVIEADGGNVYIKAYGPEKTMESAHESLQEMLNSMKVSDG